MVLRTRNLTKKYGKSEIVKNVNMTVERGDIYGFIGRNGAGKSSFMKMILGLTIPSSGEIELFGEKVDIGGNCKIGSLIEMAGLYKDCSAYENMKRFSYLTDSSDNEIKEILDFVGLGNVGNKKVKNFSLGMKQRLGIAISLIGNPKFIVLDEPVNGLDPQGIREIRNIILKLNKEKGITFLISSHLLDELSKIATKFGIINNGELIEEISSEKLFEKCNDTLKNQQLCEDDSLLEKLGNQQNMLEKYFFERIGTM